MLTLTLSKRRWSRSQAGTTVSITPPQCQADTQPPTAPTSLSGSASGPTIALSRTAPATTFTDSTLAANTTYQYDVVARDAQANASAHSNTVSVTTGTACGSSVCAVTQIATDTDMVHGIS